MAEYRDWKSLLRELNGMKRVSDRDRDIRVDVALRSDCDLEADEIPHVEPSILGFYKACRSLDVSQVDHAERWSLLSVPNVLVDGDEVPAGPTTFSMCGGAYAFLDAHDSGGFVLELATGRILHIGSENGSKAECRVTLVSHHLYDWLRSWTESLSTIVPLYPQETYDAEAVPASTAIEQAGPILTEELRNYPNASGVIDFETADVGAVAQIDSENDIRLRNRTIWIMSR